MPNVAKTPGGRRRRARGVVFSSLYAHYTTGKEPLEVFAAISDKESLGTDPAKFAKRPYLSTLNNAADIDSYIREAAANWSFDRISFVDKNILRLAIAELVFLGETPPRTAINEAIELAREYSSEDSCKFVNGVLDTVFRKAVASS